jgi:adenosylcobinamide-phosphate synthase
MAAMALALGVRLGKPGAYVLHAPGRAPEAADTQRAVDVASKTVAALYLLAWAAIVFVVFLIET